MSIEPLTELTAGMALLAGGDRIIRVTPELAGAFQPGDRLAVAIAGGDPGDHSKVLVYSPCAVDGGWGVDAVLDVPPAPTDLFSTDKP